MTLKGGFLLPERWDALEAEALEQLQRDAGESEAPLPTGEHAACFLHGLFLA
jgi:hypothetical protein